MAKHDSVYIVVPGAKQGGRIGLVKYNEKGYYQTDFDNAPVALEIVESVVKDFNERLGIPEAVVEAMHAGSMFGWHVPGAKAAHDYFGVGIHQRIDAKVEAGVSALTSAVDRAEAKTGVKLDTLTITEAPTPQLVDITPRGCQTVEGTRRVAKAQEEWDSATHELANVVKGIMDGYVYGEGLNGEDVHQLKLLIRARDVKQEAFLRAVSGR